MKYTIVGCMTKYGVDQIKPFVESIEQSGFKGDKLMLIYEVSNEVIEYLIEKGWQLAQSQEQQHIILQRFRDMYALLNDIETDVVIWVDVKDVIFQRDPTIWLDKYMKKDILAFSESLQFNNEPWAQLNAGTSFPMVWGLLYEKEIYCAGTIVGKKLAIQHLFIEIYRWALTTANPDQLGDQAAYNILINLEHFKNSVQFVKQQEGFAAQLHLKFRCNTPELCTEEMAKIDGDKIINSTGELFTIVHQYDRDEELKTVIENKYK